MSTATSVLIGDDSPELRAVVRALLEREGIAVAGEAVDGDDVVRSAADLAPDVVILDATMPGPEPEAVIAALAALDPAPGIVVYSGWPSGELSRLGVAVVSKGADPAQLVQAVAHAQRARRAER